MHLKVQRFLRQALRPLTYACFLLLVDSLGLLLWLGLVPREILVLVLFLEGGLGLLLGVVIALSATPSMAKVGEVMIGASPWSREGEDHARKMGRMWMLASALLILMGFIVSIV